MNKEEIYDWIARELEESFEVNAKSITPEARLYEDLDIDSIDAVDLIVKLKQLTKKPMQQDTFKSVRTVGDVVDAVYSLSCEE